ncbi:MAG: DUF1214 domain-containing protein [Robiginitomaculum sp.]|nr:DUF1214 domain-containing protein [Robiginitomaculum sp.]
MLKHVMASLIIIIAAISGSYAAYFSVRTGAESKSFIHNGPWRTSLFVGAKDADPHIRAYVAVIGLLGLSRKETIYFQAYSDDTGAPLSSDSDYEIIGEKLPARWWSLTLYDHDNYLTPNSYNRYSIKGTEAKIGDDGGFRIVLSREPHEGNWIPMGEGQNMSISIRMYNPNPGVENHLTDLHLPSIRKIGEKL